MLSFQCHEKYLDKDIRKHAESALEILRSRQGKGHDFLGWLDLPNQSRESLDDLIRSAEKIRESGDLLICIGIGGSYLGAKSVITALFGDNHHIRFAGQHISAIEMNVLLNELKDRDFYLLVISKSGTTTEPGIAFRLLRELAESRYGEQSADRIMAVTDPIKGALKTLCDRKGYKRFVIPENVGGRFSVLTPVGLLPICAAGANFSELMAGARKGLTNALARNKANPALTYCTFRMGQYNHGKAIEILATFEPRLSFVAEWWKQLFGESEGKEQKGFFPASANFTTDLHSLGQWIQDGPSNKIETFCVIDDDPLKMSIPIDEDNLDGLNYLCDKTVHDINMKAYEATREAHESGKVPTAEFCLNRLDEANLMELFLTFEVSIAVSAYMLDVNPFNQPGVEAYKKNMFRLLGKPGF